MLPCYSATRIPYSDCGTQDLFIAVNASTQTFHHVPCNASFQADRRPCPGTELPQVSCYSPARTYTSVIAQKCTRYIIQRLGNSGQRLFLRHNGDIPVPSSHISQVECCERLSHHMNIRVYVIIYVNRVNILIIHQSCSRSSQNLLTDKDTGRRSNSHLVKQ